MQGTEVVEHQPWFGLEPSEIQSKAENVVLPCEIIKPQPEHAEAITRQHFNKQPQDCYKNTKQPIKSENDWSCAAETQANNCDVEDEREILPRSTFMPMTGSKLPGGINSIAVATASQTASPSKEQLRERDKMEQVCISLVFFSVL